MSAAPSCDTDVRVPRPVPLGPGVRNRRILCRSPVSEHESSRIEGLRAQVRDHYRIVREHGREPADGSDWGLATEELDRLLSGLLVEAGSSFHRCRGPTHNGSAPTRHVVLPEGRPHQCRLVGPAADWTVLGTDSYAPIDVRAQIRTDDGADLYIHYNGSLEVNEAALCL